MEMLPDLTLEEIEALVAEEEARWQTAYEAIEVALKKKEQEFKQDRTLARAMTSEMVATRREEEKMLLLNDERVSHSLSQLRKSQALSLDSLLEAPYFARVVCKEGEREFEFRLGTASFPEERIVDWRESPLAAIYYNYTEGDSYCEVINDRDREGIVVSRRSYRGEGRRLLAIEFGNFSIRIRVRPNFSFVAVNYKKIL